MDANLFQLLRPHQRSVFYPNDAARITQHLIRERREQDRRAGRNDSRVFQKDRRLFERRFGRNQDFIPVDDDMLLDVVVATPTPVGDHSRDDLTRIVEVEHEGAA